MKPHPARFALLWLLALAFAVPEAHAQIGLDEARASLRDVGPFFVRVDVEGSPALSEHPALRDLTRAVTRRLSDGGARPVSERDERPYLYVHVNALEMDNGLIPFAVSLQFLQTVRLARERTVPTTGCTWEAATVGLVTPDNVALIAEAALDLADEFAMDLRAANH
ncbi:hypothetical protein [Rhodocaloribacter sp.]